MPYPKSNLIFRCVNCGGVFSAKNLVYEPDLYTKSNLPGMWRYFRAFGLDSDCKPCYLGEGDTPLVSAMFDTKEIFLKCEHLNPSGSFKDRQSALLLSLLRQRGINTVLEDSSGNAGASLAMYGAAFGVKPTIFVPSSSAGPKRQQIEMFGANVVPVEGPRINATKAVHQAQSESGVPYASHAFLPFGLVAYATIAFEIYEKSGKMPGRVFAPIGHGSLFLGLFMGFEAIEKTTGIKRPRMVGVQAENCSPVYSQWKNIDSIEIRPTVADGTAVSEAARAKEIVSSLRVGYDEIEAVNEASIARSNAELASKGFYVEASSALVWAGAKQVREKIPLNEKGDWVFILTGNGLKSIQNK